MKPIIILSVIFVLLGITYNNRLSLTQSPADCYAGYGLVVSPCYGSIRSDKTTAFSDGNAVEQSQQSTQEPESSDHLHPQLSGKSLAIGFSVL